MNVLLSGVTLPVVALLLGMKAIQSRSEQHHGVGQPGEAADWWWGDERLPPLSGKFTPKL
ncbi:MAG: hypothetical protein AAF268_11185 [Cyanobacteria bacterium P01_A01_bin.3]